MLGSDALSAFVSKSNLWRVNFLELSFITDEIIDLIHAWNVNEQYLLRKLISDIKKTSTSDLNSTQT